MCNTILKDKEIKNSPLHLVFIYVCHLRNVLKIQKNFSNLFPCHSSKCRRMKDSRQVLLVSLHVSDEL